MNYDTIECPECGSEAIELPDENGDAACALCHTLVNVSFDPWDDDNDGGEDIPERRRHEPEVAETRARPVALQISDRLAGAGSSAREAFLTDDQGGW